MSVLIDHQLRGSPKWLALTLPQRARLIELWMWIDEQETDGHVPDFILRELRIAGKDLAALTTSRVAGKGPWLDRNGGGWTAHDWHAMNPPLDPEAREKWFRRRRQSAAADRKRNTENDNARSTRTRQPSDGEADE